MSKATLAISMTAILLGLAAVSQSVAAPVTHRRAAAGGYHHPPAGIALTASDYNGYPAGYCTYFAAIEFDKVAGAKASKWGGNAGKWADRAAARGWVVRRGDPRLAAIGLPRNSIVVWSGGGFGHVGVYRYSNSKGIHIDEMNWGTITDLANGKTVNFGRVTPADLTWAQIKVRGTKTKYTFQGYILPIKRR